MDSTVILNETDESVLYLSSHIQLSMIMNPKWKWLNSRFYITYALYGDTQSCQFNPNKHKNLVGMTNA